MEIIEPYVQIMDDIDESHILSKLELCGRTAYKSEDKITKDSASKFIRSIIKSGHGSVLEHVNITVKFICDRGVTHELVRHRIASYTQESTRYCNYYKKGIVFIRPPWGFDDEDLDFLERVELQYNNKISEGQTPQQARAFLPNCLKTEIVTTMNVREWRHVLGLRTKPDCHPQMRQMMMMLLKEFRLRLPLLFEDIDDSGQLE
jgi:thymidylate synthase (FAD)